jgi:hypothetical protein
VKPELPEAVRRPPFLSRSKETPAFPHAEEALLRRLEARTLPVHAFALTKLQEDLCVLRDDANASPQDEKVELMALRPSM